MICVVSCLTASDCVLLGALVCRLIVNYLCMYACCNNWMIVLRFPIMEEIALFCVVFTSIISLRKAAITNRPSNTVGELASYRVTLGCSTNDGLYYPSWIYYRLNKAEGCVFITGSYDKVFDTLCPWMPTGRYYTDHGNNKLDLLIDGTQMEDAGTYVCRDYYNVTSAAAVYGVIGTNLRVEPTDPPMVIQGTPLDLRCTVSYNGSNAMPLLLQWNDAHNKPLNSSTTTNSSSVFQSSVTVKAMSNDMFPLKCTVTFSPPTYDTVPGIIQSPAAPTYTKQALSTNYNVILVPPPTSATALTLSSTEIEVSWTPPQNLSTVASYRLACCDSTWTTSVLVGNSRYTMTGLTPGVNYTVYIASCGNPEATYCGDTITATNNTVPAAPGTLKFTDATTNSLTVYWEQPGHADNYTIYVNYLLTTTYTLKTDNSTVTAYITNVESATATYCLSVTAVSGTYSSQQTIGCVDPASLDKSSVDDTTTTTTTTIIALSVLFAVFVVATCVLAFFLIRQSELWPKLKCHCKCQCINCVDLVRSQSSHSVSSNAPSGKDNDYETTRTSSQQQQQQHKHNNNSNNNNYSRRRGVHEEPESSYANVAELTDIDMIPKESVSSGVYESMPDGSVSYTDNVFAMSIK